MAAQKGRLFVLKQGTASAGTTIAGLRATSFTVNNETVDVTTKDSAGWRALLADGGVQSLTISAEGVFDDSTVEETVRGYAFANSIDAFGLVFENADTIDGSFQITSYERGGSHNGEETYSINLESSGSVTFTAA